MAVDIPWKYLSVCIFLAACVFGCLVSFIKSKILKGLFIIGVLGIAFYGNRNHLRVNKYVTKEDREYYESFDTSNQYNDYAPKWFVRYKHDPGRVKLKVMKGGEAENKIIENKEDRLVFQSNVKSQMVQIMPGIIDYPGWSIWIDGEEVEMKETQGNVLVSLDKGLHEVELKYRQEDLMNFGGDEESKMISRKSNEVIFETEVTSSKATVMTRVVKYPGWKLFVDGNEREVRAKDGKIIVEMGKGKHIVKLVFENTWLRIVANLLSLLTLGLVGVILVKSVKYKNRE